LELLDTGALYRAITFLSLSIKSENPQEIIAALMQTPISFISNPREPKVLLGARDISVEIRSHEVTEKVSLISALPEIRAELLNVQRTIIAKADRGIVVEGRDIGTVVCPRCCSQNLFNRRY
jgi:GTP-binding protein